MPLYEVAVIRKPTTKQQEETGSGDSLIMAPKPIVAKDEKRAIILALNGVKIDDIDNCEVLVRPFSIK